MALEIERKYRLERSTYTQLKERLQELRADFAYEVFEENFLHRGGVLDGRNAALRLRKTDQGAVLTYKEKVSTESDFKQQIEFETSVGDVNSMEQIIERLGFKVTIYYQKRRSAWQLGPVEVVLDELPFGLYMEIEGEMDEILRAEELLDAAGLEREIRGYPSLTLQHGRSVNGVFEARFEQR